MKEGRNRRNSWLRRLARNQRGSVMMEYIVIGLLIAAVSIAAVRMFGTNISNMFGALTVAVVKPSSVGTEIGTIQNGLDAGKADVATHIKNVTGTGTGTGD